MKNILPQIGKVIFAGAGPGDPELITVKAAHYLQEADIVLTDRLVSEEILSRYVKKAEIIFVGKQCGRGASTSQSAINELMVNYALKGKLVVRLKGGDVSIFSNILDELLALVHEKICYEIIPGVTAALGAAAYAGIPLTARGLSTAVRFVTYYRSDIVNDSYWRELANTDDTLIFYMSAETLDEVVNRLLTSGISTEKQLAIIEQATTPYQRVYTSALTDYVEKFAGIQHVSPTIVIVGKVVALHEQFKWLMNSEFHEEYFKPVEAKLISHKRKEARA